MYFIQSKQKLAWLGVKNMFEKYANAIFFKKK